MIGLIHYQQLHTAKAYQSYLCVQNFKRNTNSTDQEILSLLRHTNKEIMDENSNKNTTVISTQRDLISGEVSKDLTRRLLLPAELVQAHDEGMIHFHDMDYFIQPMFNCCIINIQDMLDNGTVINGKMVESPQSFQVVCTVLTQIIAQVASNQYGGQSVNIKHLGKYLYRSKKRYQTLLAQNCNEDILQILVRKELESGVQTIQYQINTLMTTNGQAPFVTLFLEIESGHPYEEEIAMIIQEIVKQRYEGIKNEKGVYITPAFPKLVYVLDENNIHKTSKYRHITDMCILCSSKRLYPDYISAKKMRKLYQGNVYSPMGCRSFLEPWQDEAGKYQFEGRFNMGVVSLNLPQMGILAEGERNKFEEILSHRLNMAKAALLYRYETLKNTPSDVSPIHWQHGAIARLDKGETIDQLLINGYATISLGYIGLYELTKLMTGESHTSEKGKQFTLEVMQTLRKTVDAWKEETGLGFGLYGTPAESLCYRFAKIDLAKYGEIKDITDKGYYTNSYHIDVHEEIDAFSKLSFESQFQEISTGGCISYIEIPNMSKNLEALGQIVEFMYDNILYSEFNTKSDYCHICGFDQEIMINSDNQWECSQCGNKDIRKMNVIRRTCGYLGDNFWNIGKTQEIKLRALHL